MSYRIYAHTASLDHDTGAGHPERAHRISHLEGVINDHSKLRTFYTAAKRATKDQICRVHDAEYYEFLARNRPEDGLVGIDGDTIMSPGTWDAAHYAAGSVCQAVDDIFGGDTKRAFCMVRPPGHHAEPHKAMGFCFFNNIAIGAAHAHHVYGKKRIAIIDFDVHHGNGTDTFSRQVDYLFYVSSHEYPLFPGTGGPNTNKDGHVLNCIISHNADGDDVRRIYEAEIIPALRSYDPDFVMISAGFDAHERDPLASVNLMGEDFGWITRQLVDVADNSASGQIVSVLEGGYDLQGLEDGTLEHLNVLFSDE